MRADADAYLKNCRDRVFRHIKEYLGARTSALPASMEKCVADYPYRRGKAIRPALLMLFSDGLGGCRAPAFKVAASYQLLEDWGLGRDDILDDAMLRRGRPALHRIYGLPKALNALDMLHVYVFDMLYSYCALPPTKYRKMHSVFTKASAVTLGGQHLDIEARDTPLGKFSERAYLRIAEQKTAFYTVTAPCLLGASMAGAERLAPGINSFGAALGTAFQIIDDVLDVENDGRGLFGKASGNDIREGKRTLVALAALRRLSTADAAGLETFYSLEPAMKSAKRIASARRLILESGAPAECREKADKLTFFALKIFEDSLYPHMKSPYRDILRTFILRIKDRTA